MRNNDFFNLYNHGFVRAAVGIPEVRVADPAFNGARTIELMEKAESEKAVLVLFPELGLTAYSCEDLFHQQALLEGAQQALASVLKASETLNLVAVVGMPLRVDHLLFNCAVIFLHGKILGVVPKTFLPNYREFYEYRQFAPAAAARSTAVDVLDQHGIPFGEHLIFECHEQTKFKFFVEICEDLWVPIPPSSHAALAGATVLVNLSASNVIIGKAEYRRQLVANQSGRCLAAYVYCGAGPGESTTDLAWDGHALVYENGNALAESARFRAGPQLVLADVDLGRLAAERMRQVTFAQAVRDDRDRLEGFRRVPVPLPLPRRERLLPRRVYERFPYVPADPVTRDERCREVYEIQVQGLVTRLAATGVRKVVIGVSGGLDSTQALL